MDRTKLSDLTRAMEGYMLSFHSQNTMVRIYSRNYDYLSSLRTESWYRFPHKPTLLNFISYVENLSL